MSVDQAEYDRVCRELDRWKTEAIQARRAHEKSEIRTVMSEAARSAGVHEGSLPYIIDRALEDGWGVDSRGRPCLKVNDRVAEYRDPKDWLAEQRTTRPHWWGDGSADKATTPAGSSAGRNPFAKDSWNMTEQGLIFKENPARAKQLAEAAGVKL